MKASKDTGSAPLLQSATWDLLCNRVLLVLLLAAVLCAVPAFAQILYGTLTGNVTDTSGAALPGTKVEALNVATGVVRGATTDENGIYRFLSLQPGIYKITVSSPNFNTFVTENVAIDANVTQRIDAQLKVAGTQQVIEVSTEPPLLQTDNADVHTELRAKQIESLPILSSQGRSFQALYRIVPGYGLPTEANSAAGNPQRAMNANVNGQSIQGNNTRIDGAQNSYPWLPANIAYVPPADAVENVNIVTNAYDAEQGTAGGAAVNVQIKSGTNQFHGTAHELYSNHALKAKDYFTAKETKDPFTGQMVPFKKPKNIQNQFGGTFGGPLIKDKLFFFGDYERTTQRQLAFRTQSVPTAAIRNGDFRGTGTLIYDPNTGNPDGTGRQVISCNGVENVICPDRFDPAAATLLGLIPQANIGGELTNYFAVGNSPYTRNTGDVKINWVPSTKSMLFGRYSISQGGIFDPPSLGAAGSDAIGGGQGGDAKFRIQNVGMGATYSFTPNVLADWNLGFTRQRLNAENVDINENFGLDVLHIPGTNGPQHEQGGIPAFQFATGTYSNLGNANTGNPFIFRDQQWVTNGNLSWITGRHALRFGIEFNRAAINHFQPQGGSFQTARGSFQFGGSPTVLGNAAPNQFHSFASFLLGLPTRVGKATQLVNPIAIRWNQWGAYARDQFQLTSRLTLSYGLRWEYYPAPYSDNERGVRFLDINTMEVLIGGVGDVPQDNGLDVGHGLFLPRAGIAYRVTDDMVIRAGYGMSADPNNFRFVRNWYPSVDNSDVQGGPSSPVASLTGTHTFAPYPNLPVGIPAPALPDIGQPRIPLPALRSTGTMANPFERGYIHAYNFTIEQNFAGFVATAGYVGTHAVRPLTNMNINSAPIGGDQAGRVLNVKFDGDWRDINQLTPFKSNSYNSLQTRLTRRFGGSQMGVVYVWSRAINYSDNEELNFLLFPHPDYWEMNRAVASFDRTHNFQFYGVYELPFGDGRRWGQGGIANALAGGWQFNWVFSHLSGTPFTINAGGGALNAPGNSQVVDIVGPIEITGCHSGDKNRSCTYFNTSSFQQPTGARFGNAGRNFIRGPGFTNLDVSLFRNFKLAESLTFQFQANAFSVTNTPHFSNPTTNCAPVTGSVECSTTPSNFGVITTTFGGNSGTHLNGARTFWFGGKLIF